MGSTIAAERAPWAAPGEHLRHRDKPDRARRLHPVLDLPRKAELLCHSKGDRLDSLEHDRDPDHSWNEDRRKAGFRRGAVPADALPDLGEDVEEDEAQKKRLDQGAQQDLPKVLAQHDDVPKHESSERGPTRCRDRAGRPARYAWSLHLCH